MGMSHLDEPGVGGYFGREDTVKERLCCISPTTVVGEARHNVYQPGQNVKVNLFETRLVTQNPRSKVILTADLHMNRDESVATTQHGLGQLTGTSLKL